MTHIERTTPLRAIDASPDAVFRIATDTRIIPERVPMNWADIWQDVYAAAGTIGDFADALAQRAAASFHA